MKTFSNLPLLTININNKSISELKTKHNHNHRNINKNPLSVSLNNNKSSSTFNTYSTEIKTYLNKTTIKGYKFRSSRDKKLTSVNKITKKPNKKLEPFPLELNFDDSEKYLMTTTEKEDVDFVLNLNELNNYSGKSSNNGFMLSSQLLKKNVEEDADVLNQRTGKSKRQSLPKVHQNKRPSVSLSNKKEGSRSETLANLKKQKEMWETALISSLKETQGKMCELRDEKETLQEKFVRVMKEIEGLGMEKELLSSNFLAKQQYKTFEKKYGENSKYASPEKVFARESIEISEENVKVDAVDFSANNNNDFNARNEDIQVMRGNRKKTRKETKRAENNEKNLNNFILSTLKAKDRKEKSTKIKEISDSIQKRKAELNSIEEKIKVLDKNLSKLKGEENEKINEIMYHYKEILYGGVDSRSEGLIWVLKAIWKLGRNIPLDYFPTFLDEKSVNFLFEYAHKSLELEDYKEEAMKLKKELKKNVNEIISLRLKEESKTNSEKNTEKTTFYSDLKRKSLMKMANLVRKFKVKNLDFTEIRMNDFLNNDGNGTLNKYENPYDLYAASILLVNYDGCRNNLEFNKKVDENQSISLLKYVSNILSESPKIELDKMEKIKQLNRTEKAILKMEAKIADLKQSEADRILKEFIEKNYGGRYNVVVEVVISALFGERNKSSLMQRFERQKREYQQNLRKIQFFDYLSNKNKFKSKSLVKEESNNEK